MEHVPASPLPSLSRVFRMFETYCAILYDVATSRNVETVETVSTFQPVDSRMFSDRLRNGSRNGPRMRASAPISGTRHAHKSTKKNSHVQSYRTRIENSANNEEESKLTAMAANACQQYVVGVVSK